MFNGLPTIVTFLPLVGVFVLLLSKAINQDDERIKRFALGVSIADFIVAFAILLSFNRAAPGLQLIDKFSWIPQWGISYFMGVDGISILMILLTVFIMPLAIYASFSAIKDQVKQYYIFMLLLQVGMVGVFLAQDLFLFYVMWEFTLIPMFFLIGIWGGSNRRYASIKFFLYTMAGSLLMLLAILYIGIKGGTFELPALIANNDLWTKTGIERVLFLGFAIAFAVKVPIFPFHSWLPDAHTEAPTAGSIILAGVMLKMGTYGFIRFNLPLFPYASKYFAPMIAVLAIIGIIYGAIVSFAQTDVKKLVAYSSVSHLGFVMLGIFSLNEQGISGGILQGVNHGISSGALFFLVGVIYEQRHTRLMKEFGGLWRAMPVFSALTLVVVLSSMGLPGLNGFVGEFTILLGSMGATEALGPNPWIYTAFATSGVILAAVYLLWMFQRVFMGPLDNPANKKLRDVNNRELAIFVAFLIFIVWIGIAPSGYFDLMSSSVKSLLETISEAVVVAAN